MTTLVAINCERGTAIAYRDRTAFDRERAKIEADDDALIRHLRQALGATRDAVFAYNRQSQRLSRLSDLNQRLAEHIRFEKEIFK